MSAIWRKNYAQLTLVVILLTSPYTFSQEQSLGTEGARVSANLFDKKNKRPAELAVEKHIALYQEMTAREPGNAIAANNLGVYYGLADRLAESAGELERAVKLDPTLSTSYVNLAIVYRASQENTKAIGALRAALALKDDLRRARAILCNILTETDSSREAVECFERLRRDEKLGAAATANFGIALIDIKEIRKATELLERGAAEYPEDPGILNGLGIAQFKTKKYSDAVRSFEKALDIVPGNTKVRYNLGMAQLHRRDKTAAIKQYNFLRESDPELAKKFYRILFADKLVFVGEK